MFSNQDLTQIALRGITPEAIEHQLTQIKEGFPFLKIEAAAAVGNGIFSPDSAQVEKYVNDWSAYLSDQHTIVKFVPASGAASRMFKNLFAFLSADYDEPTTDFEKRFFGNIHDFAFYDALNDLKSLSNLDIYVTGSNSRMLSSDILTEFRGRSDEIRVHPLSFAEYYSAVGGDKQDAFDEFAFYGGMPLILSRPTDAAKMAYLKSLFSEVYLKDIVERKKIKREDVLSAIIDLLCSSIGSLTNPTKVAATINTMQKRSGENVVALNTVNAYMDHLSDSFLFSECKRWDVKGKSYFDYPNKYYCEDIGLRNARIGFRQQEMTHIMENIIYNELLIRECSVDIGIVYSNEKNAKGKVTQRAREIDFIATSGGKKTYIQSAYALGTEEKAITENKPFTLTGDSFPKIIVRHDIRKRWYDERGILNIDVIDFLLDDTLL